MKVNLNSVPRLACALGAMSGLLSALVRVAPVLGLETTAQTQQHDMFDSMESMISSATGASPESGATGATALAESESDSSSVSEHPGFKYPSANPLVDRDCAEPDPNVNSLLGKQLCACGVKGQSPKPGYYRNGFCQTDATDFGSHILCGKSTTKFLDSQERKGNPLRSVIRHDGDEWCFCAVRWRQGYCMGEAVPVVLEATSDEVLKKFGITKRMVDDANDPNNGGVTQKYDCAGHMLL